jgi:hypothetical protein
VLSQKPIQGVVRTTASDPHAIRDSIHLHELPCLGTRNRIDIECGLLQR